IRFFDRKPRHRRFLLTALLSEKIAGNNQSGGADQEKRDGESILQGLAPSPLRRIDPLGTHTCKYTHRPMLIANQVLTGPSAAMRRRFERQKKNSAATRTAPPAIAIHKYHRLGFAGAVC